VGLTTLPWKRENVEKPPRNSAGLCGGGQGLSWAVEPRKEEEEERRCLSAVNERQSQSGLQNLKGHVYKTYLQHKSVLVRFC
jgi:hypothetical protein